MKIGPHTFEKFISASQLSVGIAKLAEQLNKDYTNCEVVFVVVLKGAFRFSAELLNQLNFTWELEFAQVNSYAGLAQNTTLKLDLFPSSERLAGKHLVFLEDIVDTGNTIYFLKELEELKACKSIRIASLLYKPSAFLHNFEIDYAAFTIENKFVVGFGLDYEQMGRNLNDIYQLKSE